MKRTSLALALAALVIFAALFYLYGGHQTPSGQPPLAELSAANLVQLKDVFNDGHVDVRMLVLLSPT
jgi:hypothetical protein